MQLWEGSLHETMEEASIEAQDAKFAIEEGGDVVKSVRVEMTEDGFYQPKFVVMSQAEAAAQPKKRSWVPWVVSLGAVLVVGGVITAAVVYSE